MARPTKYPFAKYAASGEPYVTEVSNAAGGHAAVERLHSAAYTFAKRKGLVCRAVKVTVEVGDDLADWKIRSAIQFADKLEAATGRFVWADCFRTATRASGGDRRRRDVERASAPRESSEWTLTVCPVCLAEHSRHRVGEKNEEHECGYCKGCGHLVGTETGPPLTAVAHPVDHVDVPPTLPEPNAPFPTTSDDETSDSESDVTA